MSLHLPHNKRIINLLKRRLFIVIPIAFLFIIFAKLDLFNVIYDKFTFNTISWYNNTALTNHIRTLLIHHNLTKFPRHCLVFIINAPEDNNIEPMDVLGRTGNGCPGDKPDALILFHIQVNRLQKHIDLTTEDGHYYHF